MARSLYVPLSAFAVLALSQPASARPPSVYINEVKVDGLRSQKFTGVDVTFDENGDVRIVAKGIKIAVDSGAQAKAAAPAGQHFWIAPMQPAGRQGQAQWDVDVYVNRVYVHRFRSKDAEPIFELTRFVHPGENVIRFVPHKEEGDRRSTLIGDFFDLVVGDGEMRAGQVMLNKITSYRRTAAELSASDEESVLNIAGPPAPAESR
jgi:hypothetical protein